MHLYVVRHGQSFVNLPDWDGLDSDSPLTPLGEKQAEALAAWLPGQLKHIDALYSSTMRRAKATAARLAAAYGVEICLDHRLREIGNNRIDHSPFPEGASPSRSDWNAFEPTERPFAGVAKAEGSESIMHFRIRVAAFIEEMIEQHPEQTIIAVCHGGVMGAVFDYCFGIGPWPRCEIWTSNTGVTHFEYVAHPGRETWRLHEHNTIEHLHVYADMLV
jgi:probable phosphoglycerate mutase